MGTPARLLLIFFLLPRSKPVPPPAPSPIPTTSWGVGVGAPALIFFPRHLCRTGSHQGSLGERKQERTLARKCFSHSGCHSGKERRLGWVNRKAETFPQTPVLGEGRGCLHLSLHFLCPKRFENSGGKASAAMAMARAGQREVGRRGLPFPPAVAPRVGSAFAPRLLLVSALD